MASNPRYANGHRRRQLRARVVASADYCEWPDCPWPGEPFDKTLHHHNPKAIEVDEIVPVSKGGDPLARSNVRALHRWCNQQRGAARAARGDAGKAKKIVATGALPTAMRW